MKFDSFIHALRASGLMPDAETVADFFFLASRMPSAGTLPGSAGEVGGKTVDEESGAGAATTDRSRKLPRPAELAADARQKSGLYAQGASGFGTVAATEIEVPEASALPQSLEIARSLRPLSRLFRTPDDGALDEEATAEQSAHLQQLILVFRPRSERWFDVALLVEEAPSMAIWSKTVSTFERMLVGLGAFRDIRRWHLEADAGLTDAAGRSVTSTALLAPDRRRIVLILTQGVSAIWQSNRLGEAILQWSHRQPTAVVQLLPERLWENTSLGEPKMLARCHRPGICNSQWDLEMPKWMKRRMSGGVALPILTLDPGSLGTWAHMLMARENAAVPSVLWPIPSTGSAAALTAKDAEVAPEDRLDRFSRIASEDGFRLATALSAGPVTLPVLRLINQTLFGEVARQDTLAQVLLGGLLRKEEDNVDPELVYFDFHPGVRDLLAALSHSDDRFAVRRQVTQYLQQHPDTTERFRVLVPHRDGKRRLPKWAEPFADESEPLLRAYGLLEEDSAPALRIDDEDPAQSSQVAEPEGYFENPPTPDEAPLEDSASITATPLPDKLARYAKELEKLNRAWNEKSIHLVQLVGAGGTGKTTLMEGWAYTITQTANSGLFWWSFQGHDSADSFFNELDTFLWPGVGLASKLGAMGIAQNAAQRLKDQPILLLLDGIDSLQYPSGSIREASLQKFIARLAKENAGLVVCTTRIPVPVDADVSEHTLTLLLQAAPAKYEFLPHAHPQAIAGLLEHFIDPGGNRHDWEGAGSGLRASREQVVDPGSSSGRIDIYKLADELALDIDDLLTTVEAARLLGFLKVEEGDATLMPAGREYAEAPIPRQKELFGTAALEHLLLLEQIFRAVQDSRDDAVPEEVFRDLLAEQFSADEVRRQIETAISWGQYGVLFGYDSVRGEFILPMATEPRTPVATMPTAKEVVVTEQERLDLVEMDLARAMQQKIMEVEIPSVDFARISVRYLTSDILGDFYDVVLSGDSVTVVLGDASGRGLRAALLARTAQRIVRGELLANQPLASIATSLNSQLLAEKSSIGAYVTIIILRLYESGVFDYINCGHVDPRILNRDQPADSRVRRLNVGNVPAGLLHSVEFQAANGQLLKGERLLMVTDGIEETENLQGEWFQDRLDQAFLNSSTLDDIVDAHSHFRAGAATSDDWTMLEVCFSEKSTAMF